jgi:hypothetical protein
MPFGVKDNSKTRKPGGTSSTGTSVISGRVKAVVLDSESYPTLYEEHGKEASLGGIAFEFLSTPNSEASLNSLPFALPLFASLSNPPVEGEVVTVITNGSRKTSTDTSTRDYYYLPPVNVWNNPHCNNNPNEVFEGDQYNPDTDKKGYQTVEQGASNKPGSKPTSLTYRSGFQEKATVFPLVPFAGDATIQGRWGNSMRFGSTNKDKSKTNWSSVGNVGDPIILLSNGRFSNSGAWNTLEEINADNSSIYLTSTQKINITTPVYLNTSYYEGGAPEDPKEFIQPQVILNSNRVGLFGRDSIIASSPKVHITGETVNMDMTGAFTVYANRVNLGSGNPEELQPALKGDSTEALLQDILEVLTALTQACVTATGTVPIASLQKFAIENLAKVQALNTSTIKSDDTFIV